MSQYVITGNPPAVPLVNADPNNPSTYLVANVDPSNTLYLDDNVNVDPSNPLHNVAIGPGQYIVATGESDLYGIAARGQTVQVSILKGVTSFFQPANLSQIGGISAFVQDTAPVGTFPINSIWFDQTTQALYTWNGSEWIQQEFNAEELLTAETIVSSLLISGIIVSGIVNGTTIMGAQIIADGGSGQFLAYTGSPALNNLIAAISGADGNDNPGNSYFKGVGAYGTTAGQAAYLTVDTSGTPWLVFRTGRPTENLLGNVQVIVRNKNAVNEQLITHVQPATITGQTDFPYIELQSESNDATITPTGILAMNSDGNIAFWYSDGVHISKKLFGVNGVLEIGDQVLLDNGMECQNTTISGAVISRSSGGVSGYPVISQTGNPDNIVNTASFTKLSSIWSIPAGDAQVGTAYRIKGYGYGFVVGTVMSIRVLAFNDALATIPIGTVAFPSSTGFDFDFEAIVRITATGATGQASGSLSANFSVDSGNLGGGSGSQGSFGANRNAEGTLSSINTTIAQNITIQGMFSATASGQFIECTFDTFERLGP